MDPSCASDMWSYMCLFAELYLNFPLFMSQGSVSHMSNLVRVSGPLPEHWKGSFAFADESHDWWYDPSTEVDSRISRQAIFTHRRPKVSQIERDHVLSVMAKGFCYDYDQRISADELLQDASFKVLLKIHRIRASDQWPASSQHNDSHWLASRRQNSPSTTSLLDPHQHLQ